jgi:hypothetical protein
MEEPFFRFRGQQSDGTQDAAKKGPCPLRCPRQNLEAPEALCNPFGRWACGWVASLRPHSVGFCAQLGEPSFGDLESIGDRRTAVAAADELNEARDLALKALALRIFEALVAEKIVRTLLHFRRDPFDNVAEILTTDEPRSKLIKK